MVRRGAPRPFYPTNPPRLTHSTRTRPSLFPNARQRLPHFAPLGVRQLALFEQVSWVGSAGATDGFRRLTACGLEGWTTGGLEGWARQGLS